MPQKLSQVQIEQVVESFRGALLRAQPHTIDIMVSRARGNAWEIGVAPADLAIDNDTTITIHVQG